LIKKEGLDQGKARQALLAEGADHLEEPEQQIDEDSSNGPREAKHKAVN
jgi:hypothetical protein